MSSDRVEDLDRAALIAALHPERDRFGQLLSQRGVELNWRQLLQWASAHKVMPLLADRVTAAGVETHVPPDAREQLAAARRHAAERNAKAVRDLERLDRSFGDERISYIVLKGPVLADQIYDTPSQRHFFDLDVVVHAEDVDRAQARLERLGYRLWGAEQFFGPKAGAQNVSRATGAMRAAVRRFGHELAFVAVDRSLLPVDLHWHVMPRGRIRGSPAKVWENTTTAALGSMRLRVLDAEATVLHLAMHAWSNRPWSFALLHLVDVAWALRRLQVDAGRLTALAERWGGTNDLARTLHALGHALNIEPPAELWGNVGIARPSRRFRKIATPARLLERYAPPAKGRIARLKQEVDWGLAMGTLRSTALLLCTRYAARARYGLVG